MDLPALLSGRCPIHSGPHQRMAERHAVTEREEPVGLRVHGRDRNAESLRGGPQQERIAYRLSRRHQQQTPRVVRERLNTTNEAVLDPPRESLSLDETE